MVDAVYDAELKIPSNLVYLRSIRVFVRSLAENAGFCREKINNIELATDEIFTNAIEHGSADTTSKIIIRCLVNDEMMKLVISDKGQGKGFNQGLAAAWSDVVESKIRLGTERGHGLFLAHNLTDEMCMEPNSLGGVDVHLTWYTGRESKYCKNANSVGFEPQVSVK